MSTADHFLHLQALSLFAMLGKIDKMGQALNKGSSRINKDEGDTGDKALKIKGNRALICAEKA